MSRPPRAEETPPHQRKQRVLVRRVPSFVRSIADAVVAKDRDLFLVTDAAGNIPHERGHGFGLYLHDARFLNVYDLRIGDLDLDALGADASRGYLAHVELTNGERLPRGGDLSSGVDYVDKHQLIVSWRRVLDGAARTLHDELTVHNAGPARARLPLQLRFGSRFEDIFRIRGLLNERTEHQHRPAWIEGALRLTAEGGDGMIRSSWVVVTPTPDAIDGTEITFQLDLEPTTEQRILVAVTAIESKGLPETPPKRSVPKEPQQAVLERKAPPAHWLEEQTHVTSGSPVFDAVLDRSFGDLRMLVSTYGQELYFAAGVPWFVALFGRDSLIAADHAMAYDPRVAADTLLLLAQRQGTRFDDWRDEQPGKILHELRVGEYAHMELIPHTPYYGSLDSTPLWLILLGRQASWTGDLGLFRRLRPNVEAALMWMDTYGDSDGDGYLEYSGTGIGGLINQGWKDSGDAMVDEHGELARPPIRLAEVQGYAYMAKLDIADLFERDGDVGRAQALREEAKLLRERFNRDFWLDDLGCYAMALEAEHRPLRVRSSNAGQVLWSGIADHDLARRTGDTLLSDALFSGWGVRTLADDERRYNPVGYHLGTVWPHDNAFIAAGLRRYGLETHAARLMDGLMDAAMGFPGYRLPELFAGFPREEYSAPVPYPVACRPQAWAAGTMPFLLRVMLGIDPDGFESCVRLRNPTLPEWLPWVELHGLRLGTGSLDLRFERDQRGEVDVDVLRRDGVDIVREKTAPV